MSIRNRKMYISIMNSEELIKVLTGKSKIILPADAEIVHVRDGFKCDLVELLVRSTTFPELHVGDIIPSEQAKIEPI